MNNTLEEFGAQTASELGKDPSDPNVQAYITQAAGQLRQGMPGVDDATIIANSGEMIKQQLETHLGEQNQTAALSTNQIDAMKPAAQPTAPAERAPTAASQVATDNIPDYQPIGPKYQAGQDKIKKDFSPEAEAAIKAGIDRKNMVNDWGRTLSLGYRVAASEGARNALDKDYEATKAENNKPLEDWQAKKAEANAELEGLIKAGRISNEDVVGKLKAIGLEQALAERKDKATIAATENDPNSITSESYRKLADDYSQGALRKQLGEEKWKTVTAQQLKAQMPMLEKQYLKVIETQQKEADRADKANDRASREKVAGIQAGATIQAANIRANAMKGQGGGTKDVSDGIFVDKQGNRKVDPAIVKNLTASQKVVGNAVTLLKQMPVIEEILPQSSQSGVGEYLGKLQNSVGYGDIGEANSRLSQFANSALGVIDSPLMKGAPSEADARRALSVINDPQARLDVKQAAITNLKDALEEAVKGHNEAIAQWNDETKERLKGLNVKPVEVKEYTPTPQDNRPAGVKVGEKIRNAVTGGNGPTVSNW